MLNKFLSGIFSFEIELACTLCPEKKFKDKRFVYKHVILFHVPVSLNDVPVSPHDDIISQYDMDTVIDGANEDQGTEGGPRIVQVFGTARQDSEGDTGLVRSDYFRNPYFQGSISLNFLSFSLSGTSTKVA